MAHKHTKCPPQRCFVLGCTRMIPRSGFGYASHMQMHVRKGEARMEWVDEYRSYQYFALGWKISDQEDAEQEDAVTVDAQTPTTRI